MATFPTTMMKIVSIEADDGSKEDIASSGKRRFRRLYSETVFTINVQFPSITDAEYQVLKAFYADNNNDEAIVFIDPVSLDEYEVSMAAPPQIEDQTNILYTIGMRLIGTLA